MPDDIFEEKIYSASDNELKLLHEILFAMQALSEDSRKKIVTTIIAYFGISPDLLFDFAGTNKDGLRLSAMRSMSPMKFLIDKQPQSDVERVACLAYYLTLYLDEPHFKTIDIVRLNTDAEQRKLENATTAMANATRNGYLIAASTKGAKQLSEAGKMFVQALPDRVEAISTLSKIRPKKRVESNKGRS